MAKVKLVHFEAVSLFSESKKLMDYLQRIGVSEIENITDEELHKQSTRDASISFEKKRQKSLQATQILESIAVPKKSLIESFTDFKKIDYSEYKVLCDKADSIEAVCDTIIELNNRLEQLKLQVGEKETLNDFLSSWEKLDIPMASKRTMNTRIFVGSFPDEMNQQQLEELFVSEQLEDVAFEIISSNKLQTCAVIIAHDSVSEKAEELLRSRGFVIPDKASMSVPSKASLANTEEIEALVRDIEALKQEIRELADEYDNVRFLADYCIAQNDKYKAFENASLTEKTFIVRGYLPERMSEEIKFELENRFICQIEFTEPDYENEDVPVLIKNNSFAAGVESITNMYSAPSNKDIDPNPIMAVFYYIFFGFMLSDAGYGILMLIFSLVARKKIKATGSNLKFLNMVFWCGISTTFWGAMFGGWFGDLIPTICTNFLGYESGPELAIWMDPVSNSMTLLMYCLAFGILQLFTGVAIHGISLLKKKQYLGAFCDTVPAYIFVTGFAILGAGVLIELPKEVSRLQMPLLLIGAVLIILTAGRSSKNIIGKLGGGVYALYNTTTGYLGDILSYSRLLALGLVTGVIANAVNLLATMPGNIIFFVLIFIVGHIINFAINVIGTYVHTNRLQYVEFFSKFYEGSGRCFTPFKINSKHFIIKEENNNV